MVLCTSLHLQFFITFPYVRLQCNYLYCNDYKVAAGNLIRRPYVNWAVKRVTRSLQVLWPRSRTNIFGSNVTGLSLPTSDVDLVVCLPPVRNLVSTTLFASAVLCIKFGIIPVRFHKFCIHVFLGAY